jgi:hypothetical protein
MRGIGARHVAGNIAAEAYLTSLRDLPPRLSDVAAPSPNRVAGADGQPVGPGEPSVPGEGEEARSQLGRLTRAVMP